jgi:UDP-N-acetylglucosamine acyltransferase
VTAGFPRVLDRLRDRYPSLLVDRIDEHEPGRRLAAVKNVTVNEEYFQGHYPGTPLLPAVLTIEALAQVATLLVVERHRGDVALRGVNRAKFRRQVVPGDRLRLEVNLREARGPLVFVEGVASVEGQTVAEAELLLAILPAGPEIDSSARVHPDAQIGSGTVVGPFAVVGPRVVLGRDCKVGASAVIDGNTSIGTGTEIFPFASIGLPPQDLKYRGEDTQLIIGCRNIFREFVTIHRGTAGGGGETTIGDDNLFMAYAHVAHDCHIGNHNIFGNAATLGGHVTVEDYAAISAYSGVHQFCRVGRYAFIGGYSVVTKDALPFAKSVGNRARVYGLNTVGLIRRGFTEERVGKLKRAYRYLLQSKLNTTQALLHIEQDPTLASEEVAYLVDFIRTTKRGVILRRGGRRSDDAGDD